MPLGEADQFTITTTSTDQLQCFVTGLEDLHIDDRHDTGAASTSGDDFENAGREPLHPRESVIDREPLRESQMTVPETPSPDMLATGKGGGRRREFLAGRNADNASPTKARGRPQRNATAANMFNDQVKNSYGTICSTAEKMFNRIRQGVTCHAAPSSLKSAFLQPLSSKLASQISIDLLACTDEEFMAMFTGDCFYVLYIAPVSQWLVRGYKPRGQICFCTSLSLFVHSISNDT